MRLLQVLPLVEAFFVMCDARTLPQTQPSSPLQSAMSAEFPLGATPGPSTMEPASQQTPSSRQHAHGGASAPSQPIAEPHVPFLRLVSLLCLRSQFAELCPDFGQVAAQILSSLHNAWCQSWCDKCDSQLAQHTCIGLFSMHSLRHCTKGMHQNLCVDVNL